MTHTPLVTSPVAIVLDFGHMEGSWQLENAGSIGDLTRYVTDHKYLERGYFILAEDYAYFHILDRYTIYEMDSLRLINSAPRLGATLALAAQMLTERSLPPEATIICHRALLAPALRVGSNYGLVLHLPTDPLPSSFHPGAARWAHRSASHWWWYTHLRREENL